MSATTQAASAAASGAGLPLIIIGLIGYVVSFFMWLKAKRKKLPGSEPKRH